MVAPINADDSIDCSCGTKGTDNQAAKHGYARLGAARSRSVWGVALLGLVCGLLWTRRGAALDSTNATRQRGTVGPSLAVVSSRWRGASRRGEPERSGSLPGVFHVAAVAEAVETDRGKVCPLSRPMPSVGPCRTIGSSWVFPLLFKPFTYLLHPSLSP